jgi:hypothetical protein
MSEAQAEWAIQSLYENMNARDELTDEEAETLLKWGEDQVMRLADQEMDEESFRAAFEQLNTLLRGMNRLAARRDSMAPADEQAALSRISEVASSIGLDIPAQNLGQFSQQAVKADIHANVQDLIAMFTSQPEINAESQAAEQVSAQSAPPEAGWTSTQDDSIDATVEDWDA